jgi:hypothetical protein
MKKQTAVEWLYDRLLFAGYAVNPEWKEKAKEMEKEQIENAFADGFVEGVQTQKSSEQFLFPQQYYNETYGKDA